MKKRDHVSPEYCKWADDGECVQGYDLSEEMPPWEFEQLPTSIVTVIKYTKYRPEMCFRR
jgi:hypothetical protein